VAEIYVGMDLDRWSDSLARLIADATLEDGDADDSDDDEDE
jgi:hypothetical protein